MITTYEFPNQWNWRIFLAITSDNESVSDILDHLNDYESCKFDTTYKDETIEAPCYVHDLKNLIGVICLNKYDFDTDDIAVCVHELTHLMISIAGANNCEINLGTTECWAYFMGNMIKMILEILNGYSDELLSNNSGKESSDE